ncbi:hypothetical protein SAMN05421548_1208 [Paraburkholderia lycopersici]|uniref:Uncharacterized protein n=1 Tax=Paraburkholderia lycopersici TaxID=416944 RepID=A0A1G6V1V8_9BURK|nr:hypothetical protein SAMN05421548_1208 [Paraburkholderia lycopersici]
MLQDVQGQNGGDRGAGLFEPTRWANASTHQNSSVALATKVRVADGIT